MKCTFPPEQRRQLKRRLAVMSATAVVTMATQAWAASDTWTGTAGDGQWATAGNWAGNQVPGTTSGTNSTDVATFTGGASTTAVMIDPNRNIAGITFDAATATFQIGGSVANSGNALYLSDGGLIQVTSNFGAVGTLTLAVNSPLVLAGTTYTLRNNGPVSDGVGTVGITIGGNISGSSSGATTLTLDGTSATGATLGPSVITGQISNGASSSLGILKNGTGLWDLRSSTLPNDYTGDTIVNAGVLRFSSVNAAPANSKLIVNGGRIRFSATGSTFRSIQLNNAPGTGSFDASNSSVVTYFNCDSGPAVWLNYDSGSYVFNPTIPIYLTGTTPMQGGIKLTANPSLGTVSLQSTTTTLDLGTVLRPFDIDRGSGSFDLRVRGPITGGGPNGGIVKIGDGILRIDNPANPFTGKIEVRQGTLIINNSNALTGLPTLVISGGSLRVSIGQTQTFGGVIVTKGDISAADSLSTVAAPGYVFNVGSGDVASVSTVLADFGGPSPLAKTGAGLAMLTGSNTYTGTTTVSSGTLVLGSAAWAPVLSGPGGADVKITGGISGRLVFDYTGSSSPAATVLALLQAAAPSNFASGQIRSSTASSMLGLGWVDDGISQVIVRATYKGDSDCDGDVDNADFGVFFSHFQQTGQIWATGDFDYDGDVDNSDFGLFFSTFNSPPLNSEPVVLGSSVPEPSMTGLLGLCVAGAFARRRPPRAAVAT